MTKLRVALADDESLARYLMTVVITNAGHEVVAEAANGARLVRRCLETDPDVIVTDLVMPSLPGDEAAKILYQLGLRKPIVFVTGRGNTDFFREFPHAAFVPKPIWPGQLAQAIEKACRGFEHFQKNAASLPDTTGAGSANEDGEPDSAQARNPSR